MKSEQETKVEVVRIEIPDEKKATPTMNKHKGSMYEMSEMNKIEKEEEAKLLKEAEV